MAAPPSGVVHGLEFQARALAAQGGDPPGEHPRFVIGTQTLRNENQMHVLQFDDENDSIDARVYAHPQGEFWGLYACPSREELVASRYSATSGPKRIRAAVYALPAFDEDHGRLQRVCELAHDNDVTCIAWHPTAAEQVVSGDSDTLFLWDIQREASTATVKTSAADAGPEIAVARWSPHYNGSSFATGQGTAVHIWDSRELKTNTTIPLAHDGAVRDIDFNPNQQHYFASCGDDGKIKFWDHRACLRPLLTLSEHTHWVWSVRYNHFHDQLLLSAGSDNRVVLSNVASLSSDIYGHMDDDEDDAADKDGDDKETSPKKDGRLATYDEHEDSVYAVEWSVADPWVFASLSFDGRVVINRVPRDVKYEILL